MCKHLSCKKRKSLLWKQVSPSRKQFSSAFILIWSGFPIYFLLSADFSIMLTVYCLIWKGFQLLCIRFACVKLNVYPLQMSDLPNVPLSSYARLWPKITKGYNFCVCLLIYIQVFYCNWLVLSFNWRKQFFLKNCWFYICIILNKNLINLSFCNMFNILCFDNFNSGIQRVHWDLGFKGWGGFRL